MPPIINEGTPADRCAWHEVFETTIECQKWFRDTRASWDDEIMWARATFHERVLWLEGWRVKPVKEAPFTGLYATKEP